VSTPHNSPRPRAVDYHAGIEEWELETEAFNSPEARVCHRCITDPELREAVEDTMERDHCGFCGTTAECVTFKELAEVVERVLDDFYVSIEESGAYREYGEWSVTPEDVQDILEYEILFGAVDDRVLPPLIRFVSARNAAHHGFVLRRHVLASLYDWDEGSWRHFMRTARAGAMADAGGGLFEQLPSDVLNLFQRIERYAQVQGMFRSAVPDLWRCRPGAIVNAYWTGDTIGSAPSDYAGDGRLNAKGQSVFYGSTTLHGAVIEMANHHGLEVELWAGQFSPTRVLYHLDLMDLPDRPSPFAAGAVDTFDAIQFLIRFAGTLRERKPEGELGHHYLPTQLFTDFLLRGHEELRPDAIKYASSVDTSSENWVVFADNDHCADAGATGLDPNDVCMLLDQETVEFVRARDLVEGRATVGAPSPSN
jgi:hypothetical protein